MCCIWNSARRAAYPREYRKIPTEFTRSLAAERQTKDIPSFIPAELTYLANVMNREAEAFYREQGACRIAPAFERAEPAGAVLMFCKHCLRYSLGWCPKHGGSRSPFREPYYLVSADGRRFRLEFDCQVCQMKVLADE